MGVHMLLYRFVLRVRPLPPIWQKLQIAANTHLVDHSESRPLFLSLMWLLNKITDIPDYWIFKVVVPLLGSGIVPAIFFCHSAWRFSPSRILLVINSLAFMAFPVVVSELLASSTTVHFLTSLYRPYYISSLSFSGSPEFGAVCIGS